VQRAFFTVSHVAQKKGGLGMFKKYSAMTMDERDSIVEEWGHTFLSTAKS
jgi:hypothetical protein